MAKLASRIADKLFQSTHPREGVRLVYLSLFLCQCSISIHAPPRRSATKAMFDSGVAEAFQSTHPREGVRR